MLWEGEAVSIDEGEVAGDGLTSGPSPKMEALFEGIKAMKKRRKGAGHLSAGTL
jgi:hypothetical protein